MLYALVGGGEKAEAEPQGRAACPECEGVMIAKCGPIVIWHWAHESLIDCDGWTEPESQWHLGWKQLFPKECVEVRLEGHRADVKIGERVIEFQHSSIDVDTITEREDFYGKGLCWMFDASSWLDNVSFRHPAGKPFHNFRWKWLHKRQRFCNRPIFWDLGDGRIFEVRRIWDDGNNGWGYFLTKDEFIARFLKNLASSDADETPLNPNYQQSSPIFRGPPASLPLVSEYPNLDHYRALWGEGKDCPVCGVRLLHGGFVCHPDCVPAYERLKARS